MSISKPNHPPKAPSPNTITLVVRVSTYEFWEAHFSHAMHWHVPVLVLNLKFALFLLFFKYSFLPFPLTSPHHPSPPHLLPLFPHPPCCCPCVLYNCSCKLFTLSPPFPSPLPSLVTVSLFSVSMSLVIFCLLVHFVD